ncbi:cytidine deaminase [Maribellus sediminis]|uniref:cytidine deaminase n=1 Tax=Maribellus sediminis TaxID=2696285 RepID=UPI001F10B1CC|nr:cytidine deaminase [Maribellus sediminis]
MNKTEYMRTREIKIAFQEFDKLEELSATDKKLVEAARVASNNAYAPYSHFHVGAALLLENGEIVEGNNQENADFTDGLCAERVALFYAHSKFPNVSVVAIAVSAKNHNGLVKEPAQPCGSCRQVMVETEVRFQKPIRIILDGSESIQILDGAESLLPLAFKPKALG